MSDMPQPGDPTDGSAEFLFGPAPATEAVPGIAELWRAAIADRTRACDAVAGGYHVLIVPDRRVVYADKLAPGTAATAGRGVDPLADIVIDPAPGLRARRRIAETYLRTASGWTDYGAYCASLDLIEALRDRLDMEKLPEPSLIFRDARLLGDLALHAAPRRQTDGPVEITRRIVHAGQRAYRRVAGGRTRDGGDVQVFEHDRGDLPRAVVFASPLAGAALSRLLPFLCAAFSRVVVVGVSDLYQDVIDTERPDAVVSLLDEADLARAPGPIRRDFVGATGMDLPLASAAREVAIGFGQDGNARAFLGQGWSAPEPEHTWSVGGASTLTIPSALQARDHELTINLAPCVFIPERPRQRLGIEVNGEDVGRFELAGRGRIVADLPAHVVARAGTLTITFRHPDFVTPLETGRDPDDRALAFCFTDLAVRPKEPV